MRTAYGLLTGAFLLGACAEPPAGNGVNDDVSDDDDGGSDSDGETESASGPGTNGGPDDDDDPDETGDPAEDTCGNGVVDGDEACDGGDLDNQTCADVGWELGTLACSESCVLVDTDCRRAPATHFGAGRPYRLPEGGADGAGYHQLAESDFDVGDRSWATVDITGDGRLDLVVTLEDGAPIENGGPNNWIVYAGGDDGFGQPSRWELPDGGADGAGYHALGESDFDVGDQSWATVDLLGDGRLDLVVTLEDGTPFNDGGSQYWLVYGSGDGGFVPSTSWALPEGGADGAGYHQLGESDFDVGDRSWATVDLTGDGLLDLVVTLVDGMPIPGGGGNNWLVYPGGGDGFGAPVKWALPAGGSDGAGFHALAESDFDVGDQSWATLDIDGDGLLDLVVTLQDGMPLMQGGGNTWIVYPGADGGFGDAYRWDLPDGGSDGAGFHSLFDSDFDVGDQSWSTVDLNGDGAVDLVVTLEDGAPIESGGANHWILYPGGEDHGFGAGTPWPLPDGGSDGVGFHALAESDFDIGDQSWATVDLTGDGRLDLVVTLEDGAPIEGGGGNNWIVYPGTP